MSGFIKKIWKDRVTEFPTRRSLTKQDGSVDLVTVAREEGTVSQEGDAFSAQNMNDLEERVKTAFDAVDSSLNKVKTYVGSDGKLHFVDAKGADTVIPFSNSVKIPTFYNYYDDSASTERCHIEIDTNNFTSLSIGSLSGGMSDCRMFGIYGFNGSNYTRLAYTSSDFSAAKKYDISSYSKIKLQLDNYYKGTIAVKNIVFS